MVRHQLMSSVALLAFAAFTAAPAFAADAPADTAPAAAEDSEEIVVFGTGETRQIQSLQAKDIQLATPGTSPIKVLSKLPSVSVQSANALGTNEWSTRISIRGFSQTQLGFTLDGVPLGDMSYGNFNGLHISRAIASENIGRSTVAQGSGALDTASSSNLGGTIQFYSMTPSDDFGVQTEASYGSENAYRLFARVESGDLGGGAKGYVSGSYLDAPKWKGSGKQEAWSINSKFIMPISDSGSIAAFLNYSNFKDDDYMDTSEALIKKYGYKWDYIRKDYKTALEIAKNLQSDMVNYTRYCEDYPGYDQAICADDTYYDGYGLRKDLLAGANIDYDFSDALSVKLTPYYHRNRGIGTWWTPYRASPTGASLSVRSTSYAINRGGVTGSLQYKIGDHTLEAGGWYEHNKYTNARLFFALDNTDESSIGRREWPHDPFDTQYKYHFKINTYQYFAQDTWQVSDEFKITAGFKGLTVKIDNSFDSISSVATRNTSGKLEAKDSFLPQVGANYTFSDAVEFFVSYTENMRAFTTDPFLTSTTGFNAIKDTIKPETSATLEGGFRFHMGAFEGSIAGYHVKFKDRLLSIQPCAIVQGCASVLSNVGSVTTNGVEIAGNYKLTRALSLYGSYAFTDAQYDDDILSGQLWETGGKTVVDSPKHLANAEINYDDGNILASIHANYQSKRYYTYINDNSVKGRILVDLTAGYRFTGSGPFDGLEIQANVTNLFDKKYIATMGQNGYTFSSPNGTLQSLLVGAPRQVFVSVRKHF